MLKRILLRSNVNCRTRISNNAWFACIKQQCMDRPLAQLQSEREQVGSQAQALT